MGIDPVAGHRKRVFPLQLVVHSQGLVCVVRESKPGLALLEVAARPETLRSRLWLQILRSVLKRLYLLSLSLGSHHSEIKLYGFFEEK